MIHPTAVIHPKAVLDPSVTVGPYAVIDEGVVIGPECVIGPYVYITGQTVIGARNRFHAGCVIGDAPQDLKYKGAPTRLRIGDNNVFREHVTVHRSNNPDEETVIGSNNFLMQHSHVAHNCVLGNHVILAGGALLAGHAIVHDRAFISGNCLVHQFTRVGTLAMMQGGAAISKDLPPFTVAVRENEICGLNIIGLRRAGVTPEERLELKRLYRLLFREGRSLSAAVAIAREQFQGHLARTMLDFIAGSKRGVCTHRARAVGEAAPFGSES
ncbi:MAG: acyl-ACP--UDP-N-acetylglucosamine O-acyltransferase [Verrucomicrobiae bacterium]|nr:acyl-ACP--UDP-N-acetylglucosamine O-acyltransferase [Verrucomicrobiae bacterium]MCX7722266.1 acyl-ACP--UDP-N-acetylglucosamine O-acyltransferase [Verrucomicrobiae bacterium]MDW7980455.1 acyl-ACP--UDP-N-acetylglucosamine O-acyltransferase [Verrucomicrobiales bacterium]